MLRTYPAIDFGRIGVAVAVAFDVECLVVLKGIRLFDARR